jgi:hypothetical protein
MLDGYLHGPSRLLFQDILLVFLSKISFVSCSLSCTPKYGLALNFQLYSKLIAFLYIYKIYLTDKVADNISENKDIIWAKGFGVITDMQVGPDGYLYVLSVNLPQDRGTIFRIVPQ